MRLAYVLCKKLLRIPSITLYIRTYARLYFMSYHFLPQRHKRDYGLFINVESDLKHPSVDAIDAMHLLPYI